MDDLKMIKKYYGERMMHLCRELFSSILETPGLLYSLIKTEFAPSHFLYEDLIGIKSNFKNYIYSLIETPEEEETIITKSPSELLDEAGYKLYECKSEADIQKFKRYYEKGEELCTFNGGRLDRCYVFFAVKKNVNEIKRKDFDSPERQDEYGTSVISIQFTRGRVNTLSIKNRYNHRVSNPDATFSNNLDNIIEGLTASFKKTYGLNINQNGYLEFEIPGYVRANDGRYYKYNYEINNVYYCPGNIIIDHFEVKRDYQEMEKYIVADYFIIDLVNKEVRLYDESVKDSFVDGFRDIKFKKIDVIKNKDTGNKTITMTLYEDEDIVIEIDKFGKIIKYINNNLKEVGDSFMHLNETLRYIKLSNLERVSDDFLCKNSCLCNLIMPKLEVVGNRFLCHNRRLSYLEMPLLRSVENEFLFSNHGLSKINLPNLEIVGDNFLFFNDNLVSMDLPKVKSVGHCFVEHGGKLRLIDLPNLEIALDGFLRNAVMVNSLELPKLREIGNSFLRRNMLLDSVNLPSLQYAGNDFLFDNRFALKIDLPSLIRVGHNFMYSNFSVDEVNLEKLYSVKDRFMYHNVGLSEISLPKLVIATDSFMYSNKKLRELYAPELVTVGNGFLYSNVGLINLDLPSLEYVGANFVDNNELLREINLPSLRKVHNDFYKKSLRREFIRIINRNRRKYLFISLRNMVLDKKNDERKSK